LTNARTSSRNAVSSSVKRRSIVNLSQIPFSRLAGEKMASQSQVR
jgi:hypothetical protein